LETYCRRPYYFNRTSPGLLLKIPCHARLQLLTNGGMGSLRRQFVLLGTFLALIPCCFAAGATKNCTAASLAKPSWAVDSLQYRNGSGALSFHILNLANNYSATLACSTRSSLENDGAHSCVNQDGSDDTSLRARVTLDNGAVQVFANQTWTCDDMKFQDSQYFP